MARKQAICTTLLALAHDLVAGAVAPLAAVVEHGEPLREARHDLAVDEAAPLALAHGGPRPDIAAEHQLGHLGRLLAAAAFHGRRLGLGLGLAWTPPASTGASTSTAKARPSTRAPEDVCYPLMRSIAAPQAESLSSSRSKPRSR